MKIQYKVSENYNGVVFFADLCLSISQSSTSGISVKFHPEFAERWKAGVVFGVEYAWERTSGPIRRGGLDVFIHHTHGHDVDTTNVVVAYAACQALWKALNHSPLEYPKFLQETGEFIFIK